jgi:hypothetical protein
MDLVTNGVIITDAINFVQQKKQELNQINSDKVISGEEEASKGSKKEKEEILNPNNADLEVHCQ